MAEKLEKNVMEFLSKVSIEVGKFEADNFNSDMYNECLEYGYDGLMESPIEHILYCSLNAVRIFNFITIGDLHYSYSGSGEEISQGLYILPQKKIGKFRCDFLIEYHNHINIDNEEELKKIKKVIVECDSQEWHERDEKERRYEKARDRYFVKEGYKVFHYTGTEILKNSIKIAGEILAYVTEIKEEDMLLNSNFGEFGEF